MLLSFHLCICYYCYYSFWYIKTLIYIYFKSLYFLSVYRTSWMGEVYCEGCRSTQQIMFRIFLCIIWCFVRIACWSEVGLTLHWHHNVSTDSSCSWANSIDQFNLTMIEEMKSAAATRMLCSCCHFSSNAYFWLDIRNGRPRFRWKVF
jgi:hypothetical protein